MAFYLDRYGYDVLPLALRMLRGASVPERTPTQHTLITAKPARKPRMTRWSRSRQLTTWNTSTTISMEADRLNQDPINDPT